VSEGDEKMRWPKKIEQREKHAYEETRNCAEGKKRGSMVGSISFVVYGGDIW
jgi:hypothetical protein